MKLGIAITMLGVFIVLLVSLFTSGRSERIVLQPMSSQPIAGSKESNNNHLHSGDQNQTYGYQEQPPACQLQDYPKRNVEIKSDYSSSQV